MWNKNGALTKLLNWGFTENLELITEYCFQFPPPQLNRAPVRFRRGEKGELVPTGRLASVCEPLLSSIMRFEPLPMVKKKIIALLQGGDRRSIGRSDQVASIVSSDAKLFPELIAGLWSADPLVRMRSADAAEKTTREHRELLQPHKSELLGLMAETQEQELRWHLAALISRLELNTRERKIVISSLQRYLQDRSSIVKTFALQGLADMVRQEPGIRSSVIDILREAARTGTPAMKARSRKLLAELESD